MYARTRTRMKVDACIRRSRTYTNV
ncbi:hypothetical protein V1477_015312 [Vespula maculifrons]|uniref:Uncharacterized protein n=1 Tax=Vespula maculifrons TaxID=7453 RepID=A0ABD2BFR0_VESMC